MCPLGLGEQFCSLRKLCGVAWCGQGQWEVVPSASSKGEFWESLYWSQRAEAKVRLGLPRTHMGINRLTGHCLLTDAADPIKRLPGLERKKKNLAGVAWTNVAQFTVISDL